jgi:protein gp37
VVGEQTAIAWTDHTFNPWWGCTRVSPGCQHCYAEAFAKRTGHHVWGGTSDRRFFGDKHWAEPLRWDRQAEADGRPHLVFCASMADVFEARADLIAHSRQALERARLVTLIGRTPHLIWQLLTKRPENVLEMVPPRWLDEWPPNVWVGTTVEDQRRADQRIPELLAIPAPVRFLSCEPLLGRVYLPQLDTGMAGVGWVIAGGESGPGHRPLVVEHVRALRDQCSVAGVPFFFKQHGGRTPTAGGDLLDGVQLKAFPSEAAR